MHQQKGKKIFIYFFLLILVGSINNIKLNDIKLNTIKTINISGLNNSDKEILMQNIKELFLKNIFTINARDIAEKIDSNTLIEDYKIFKKYPSTLNIKIKKTKFLAKINYKGKIYLLGTNGKLSNITFSTKQLPFIFGNPEIYKILNLKKIIDQSKISYDQIKNLYYYPSGRWDLELKNNVMIKLPKDNTDKTLDEIFDFLNNKDFEKVKLYDARIKNQIILNE